MWGYNSTQHTGTNVKYCAINYSEHYPVIRRGCGPCPAEPRPANTMYSSQYIRALNEPSRNFTVPGEGPTRDFSLFNVLSGPWRRYIANTLDSSPYTWMVAVVRSSPSTVRWPGCWPGGTRGSSLKAVTGIISTPGVYTCELGKSVRHIERFNWSCNSVLTLFCRE